MSGGRSGVGRLVGPPINTSAPPVVNFFIDIHIVGTLVMFGTAFTGFEIEVIIISFLKTIFCVLRIFVCNISG